MLWARKNYQKVQKVLENLTEISELLVKKMISKKVVSDSEKEIYQYGMESLLFLSVNIGLTLLVGFITNRILNIVCILGAFIPIRSFAGGYHMKSKAFCSITSTLIIMVGTYCADVFNIALLLGAAISLIILSIMPPIECDNRKYDLQERKYFRKCLRNVIMLETILIITLYWLQKYEIVKCICIAVILAFVICICGMVHNYFVRRK